MRVNIFCRYSLVWLACVLVSCGKGGDTPTPPTPPDEFKSEELEVTIDVTADKLDDVSFEWTTGDKLSLLYVKPDEVAYSVPLFTSQAKGVSGKFKGKLWSWENTKDLYAIYDRGQGVTEFTLSGGNISVTKEQLTADVSVFGVESTPSQREMGILVSKVTGAKNHDSETCSIPTFNLKQVASFWGVHLSGTCPTDTEIVSLELKAKNTNSAPFISTADVSMQSASVVVKGDMTSTISQNIGSEGTDINDKYLFIPLFPILIDEALTLTLSAKGVGDKQGATMTYTYDFDGGMDFVRSKVNRDAYLQWSDMTYTVLENILPPDKLGDMAAENKTPEGDNWIVKDTEAGKEEETLNSLSDILSNNTIEQGSITVELADITTLPDNLFSGAGVAGSANTNAALGVVKAVGVKEVGVNAFNSNTSVREVILSDSDDTGALMGDDVLLNEGVFENCTSLETCQVKTKRIPRLTFKDCGALRQIDTEGIQYFGESSCEGCSSLFTEGTTTPKSRAGDSAVELVLNSVTEIESRAFFGCTQFDALRLNEDSDIVVTSLAQDAFSCLVGGTEQSHTPNMVLYLSSSMKDKVKGKVLSIGSTTLTFKTIYVDGVEVEEPQQPDGSIGGSGSDATVEEL